MKILLTFARFQTMNTYTPIPDDLPPLPEFDATTHWPKCHAPSELWNNGKKTARYFTTNNQGGWDNYTAIESKTPAHVPAGFMLQTWLEGLGKWSSSCTRRNWEVKISYREEPKAPPAPVFCPLDDYRVSEAIYFTGKVHLITEVHQGDIRYEGANTEDSMDYTTPQELMDTGAKIHRNGQWVPCKVERKG